MAFSVAGRRQSTACLLTSDERRTAAGAALSRAKVWAKRGRREAGKVSKQSPQFRADTRPLKHAMSLVIIALRIGVTLSERPLAARGGATSNGLSGS